MLKKLKLESRYFAEGICVYNDVIFQLTWKTGKCFLYEAGDFLKQKTFFYEGEGWGITSDEQKFFMSDGSEYLSVRDIKTFELLRKIKVETKDKKIFKNLNELEYAKGKIYANVWMQDFILVIDPSNGDVLGEVDCSTLEEISNKDKEAVLNGIAYDEGEDVFYLTGKRWKNIYKVVFEKKRS